MEYRRILQYLIREGHLYKIVFKSLSKMEISTTHFLSL